MLGFGLKEVLQKFHVPTTFFRKRNRMTVNAVLGDAQSQSKEPENRSKAAGCPATKVARGLNIYLTSLDNYLFSRFDEVLVSMAI